VVTLSKLRESVVPIDQYDSRGHGALDGYVVDTSKEQIKNYLDNFRVNLEITNELKSKFKKIAIIKNINVEEKHRGEGIGNKLLSYAIDDAYDNGAEAIILIADKEEENQLDLIRWYENYGFEKLTNTISGPLMILDEQ